MRGGSNKEWIDRERRIREQHRQINVALLLWPRPRPIGVIEAEEYVGFVQPASGPVTLKTPEELEP